MKKLLLMEELLQLKKLKSFKKTDGVMIGRAAYHTPYLLAEIEKEIFKNDNIPSRQEVIEKFNSLYKR